MRLFLEIDSLRVESFVTGLKPAGPSFQQVVPTEGGTSGCDSDLCGSGTLATFEISCMNRTIPGFGVC